MECYIRPPFESIQVANIIRTVEFLDDLNTNDNLLGSFRVYKMKLSNDLLQSLNSDLVNDALRCQIADSNNGLDVSNAGGYHSFTTYFESNPNPSQTSNFTTSVNVQFSQIASQAVEFAEANDFTQSQFLFSQKDITNDYTNQQDRLRIMEAANTSEAWININRHGHWNRLHTHQGSSWSGIYYAQCPTPYDSHIDNNQQISASSYSGKLLMKPSPHITENNYELSKIEMARLNCFHLQSCSQTFKTAIGMSDSPPSFSCCDYLEIEPEVGMFIIMPGWLQHAVCPLNIVESLRETKQGTRISLAFNFVGK